MQEGEESTRDRCISNSPSSLPLSQFGAFAIAEDAVEDDVDHVGGLRLWVGRSAGEQVGQDRSVQQVADDAEEALGRHWPNAVRFDEPAKEIGSFARLAVVVAFFEVERSMVQRKRGPFLNEEFGHL